MVLYLNYKSMKNKLILRITHSPHILQSTCLEFGLVGVPIVEVSSVVVGIVVTYVTGPSLGLLVPLLLLSYVSSSKN